MSSPPAAAGPTASSADAAKDPFAQRPESFVIAPTVDKVVIDRLKVLFSSLCKNRMIFNFKETTAEEEWAHACQIWPELADVTKWGEVKLDKDGQLVGELEELTSTLLVEYQLRFTKIKEPVFKLVTTVVIQYVKDMPVAAYNKWIGQFKDKDPTTWSPTKELVPPGLVPDFPPAPAGSKAADAEKLRVKQLRKDYWLAPLLSSTDEDHVRKTPEAVQQAKYNCEGLCLETLYRACKYVKAQHRSPGNADFKLPKRVPTEDSDLGLFYYPAHFSADVFPYRTQNETISELGRATRRSDSVVQGSDSAAAGPSKRVKPKAVPAAVGGSVKATTARKPKGGDRKGKAKAEPEDAEVGAEEVSAGLSAGLEDADLLNHMLPMGPDSIRNAIAVPHFGASLKNVTAMITAMANILKEHDRDPIKAEAAHTWLKAMSGNMRKILFDPSTAAMWTDFLLCTVACALDKDDLPEYATWAAPPLLNVEDASVSRASLRPVDWIVAGLRRVPNGPTEAVLAEFFDAERGWRRGEGDPLAWEERWDGLVEAQKRDEEQQEEARAAKQVEEGEAAKVVEEDGGVREEAEAEVAVVAEAEERRGEEKMEGVVEAEKQAEGGGGAAGTEDAEGAQESRAGDELVPSQPDADHQEGLVRADDESQGIGGSSQAAVEEPVKPTGKKAGKKAGKVAGKRKLGEIENQSGSEEEPAAKPTKTPPAAKRVTRASQRSADGAASGEGGGAGPSTR